MPNQIEPQISYSIQDKYIRSLSSAFPPLDKSELKQEWGKEYMIGVYFAKNLDLYRAITAFKRAEIFIPPEAYHRKQEIEYFTILSYFLGNRFEDVIDTFDDSSLGVIDQKFPTYHDLLIILYESYKNTDEDKKAERVLEILKTQFPETAKRLKLSTSLSKADFHGLQNDAYDQQTHKDVNRIITSYQTQQKSIPKAQTLQALFPGAGYFYVGQKQSALTSFLLNGLFISAAVNFFLHGHTAAGIVTTSIEAGWYFGGIYGSGEAAKLYNERLYEAKAFETLGQRQLFPTFCLSYGF